MNKTYYGVGGAGIISDGYKEAQIKKEIAKEYGRGLRARGYIDEVTDTCANVPQDVPPPKINVAMSELKTEIDILRSELLDLFAQLKPVRVELPEKDTSLDFPAREHSSLLCGEIYGFLYEIVRLREAVKDCKYSLEV